MTSAERLQSRSFAEFLAGEQLSQVRHEWVGGRTYAMAGGSERHSLAIQQVFLAVHGGARAAGCRAHICDRLLHTASAAYYPDVFVTCGLAADTYHDADATLVVEVLSPSTMEHDRREKAIAYAGLPSLRHYLLVDPIYVRMELATRVGDILTWGAYGSGSVVFLDYGQLVLDDFYGALDAQATT